jgi:hypothetical protein
MATLAAGVDYYTQPSLPYSSIGVSRIHHLLIQRLVKMPPLKTMLTTISELLSPWRKQGDKNSHVDQ